MSYPSKDEVLQNRQLKVQTVCIPFTIVGNATAGSVVPRNDEPSRLFLATAGVNQITAALATNETATYTTAAADATGVFQAFLKTNESLEKVVSLQCFNRVTGAQEPAFLGSATGISTGTGGGKSIMIVVDSGTALNASNTLDACLVIKYVTAE